MKGFIKGITYIFFILLFIAPVPARTDLLLPGDMTRPAAAQIPLLPEYFSISAALPVPSPLTSFAPSAVVSRNSLIDPLLPSDSCDACQANAPSPLPLDISDSLAPIIPMPLIDPKLPITMDRSWLKTELAGIYDPDPWQTYFGIQQIIMNMEGPKESDTAGSKNILNAFYLRREKGVEREKIRKRWEETIGVDIWYPYYKVKEIERWVKARFSFRIRKIKCKPRIKKGLANYICVKRF